MAEITMRRTTLDDVMTIAHHRTAMFADMGVGTEQTRAQGTIHFSDWLQEALQDGTYLGWFACDGERVIAGAGIWLLEWIPGFDGTRICPYVFNVYTEPDYRRRGLARQLMTTLIDYCRAAGYARLRLHASLAGQTLYESLGFVDKREMELLL